MAGFKWVGKCAQRSDGFKPSKRLAHTTQNQRSTDQLPSGRRKNLQRSMRCVQTIQYSLEKHTARKVLKSRGE